MFKELIGDSKDDVKEDTDERKHAFITHLENHIGKASLDVIFKSEEHRKLHDEFIGDTKGGIKKSKKDDTKKDTKGFAGSDIEALVNSAIERIWNSGKNVETDIFPILLAELKYMTPLKEVLAEKLKKNKEKFGQYKLTSASVNETNLRRFETDSEDSKENKLAIAREEQCPDHILRKLAKDNDKDVKCAVLDNPACPTECIIDLMNDANHAVRKKAEEKRAETPAGVLEIAKSGTTEQKLNLFKRNISGNEEALVLLANTGHREIIEKILGYSSVPDAVWTAVASQARAHEEIKTLLSVHPNLSEERKKQLQRPTECCLNFLIAGG